MDQAARSPENIAWYPNDSVRARSRLGSFLKYCGIQDYGDLYTRSVDDVAWFTETVLNFLEIQFDRPYAQLLDLSRGMPWARWCVGGGLNITRSCLDRYLNKPRASAPAIIWEGEEGHIRSVTYGELFAMVQSCGEGLRTLGIRRGDAVGVHLPMMPETVVALLALARIGAVSVPLFSGFGPAAIESRLRDVEAKALFTCDAFPRRGVAVPAHNNAAAAIERSEGIRHLIVVPRMGVTVPIRRDRDLFWDDLISLGVGKKSSYCEPEATDAEDPLMILYISGTTGNPKGIVHSHCGFPIKAAQDMCFGTDVGPGDRISWITDIGWMMGPWLVYGSLLLGATMALYDGAPDYPDCDRIWKFASDHRVEILGLSPSLVNSMSSNPGEPRKRHDLSSLRILASTGETWNPSAWFWLFEKVGGETVPIINYSGGTEISGGILMGNPLLSIKPCSFSGPCPGIAADVVDEKGRPLRSGVGELAIRKPWIGMARGFWKDPERYLSTYWADWPDIWRHGDWASIAADGHWQILGRSDDTLKIAGRRVGPAEIESVLISHPSIAEAAIVGVPHDVKGTVAIAFCVPTDMKSVDPTLDEELRQLVAQLLGKPLCPEKVFLVPSLPHTRNSKIMRRVLRDAFLGESLGNISALENPESVEAIRRISIDANTRGNGDGHKPFET